MSNNTDEIKFNEMDERIERFLRGQMTPEEETQFHEDINNNPDLREQALVVSSLIKGLRFSEFISDYSVIRSVQKQSEEPLRHCGMEIADDEEETPPEEPKKPNNLRRLIIWSSSIAAALALVIGYNFYAESARYAQVNEMLSPYYEHYDPTSLSRGDADSVTIAHLYTLFNRIQEEKDMKGIIAELEPIYESIESDFIYYPYANDIAWNLALAYVKAGEKDKAISVLETIVHDNEETPIADRAKALIETLKSRK